jgi:hypothetical protein
VQKVGSRRKPQGKRSTNRLTDRLTDVLGSRGSVRSLSGTWWIGAASLAIPLVVVGVSLVNQPVVQEESQPASKKTSSETPRTPTSVEVLGKSVTKGMAPTTKSPSQPHRVTGSLPASAAASVESTTTVASLKPLPAWRLGSPVSYASGAIKAKPLPRSVRPLRLRSAVTSTATKVAANQFGGSLRPADVDVFFAEYDAPVGEWLGKIESVETEPRSVWFVVFTGMESKRSTGIVRAKDRAVASTTLSLDVTSDVVVVIDDDTGEVLVASEFLSEYGGRYTRR